MKKLVLVSTTSIAIEECLSQGFGVGPQDEVYIDRCEQRLRQWMAHMPSHLRNIMLVIRIALVDFHRHPAYLMTQQLVHNPHNLLWKQTLLYIVFIVKCLSRFQVAAIHLRIHDLRSPDIYQSLAPNLRYEKEALFSQHTSKAPTASQRVKDSSLIS